MPLKKKLLKKCKPKKDGPKTLLDSDMIEFIRKCALTSPVKKDWAYAAKISEATLYSWLRTGGDLREMKLKGNTAHKKNCLKLLETIKKAQAELKLGLLASIKRSGQSQWQANAWLLERCFPQDFARLERREVTGKDGQPIQQNINQGLTDQAIETIKNNILGIDKDNE